ncbi:MAG TPA: hypothetical protein VN680_01395 [Burkholderiaceae bacterium]|jgi:hypothetical protein|nr:hypothetical protein [Burkholderiaceae bacterium]
MSIAIARHSSFTRDFGVRIADLALVFERAFEVVPPRLLTNSETTTTVARAAFQIV